MIQSIRVVSSIGVFLQLSCSGLMMAEEKVFSEKNAVIIGASSMNGLPELVELNVGLGAASKEIDRVVQKRS